MSDNDGLVWIKHDGSGMPVAGDVVVAIKVNGESEVYDWQSHAGSWNEGFDWWVASSGGYHIISEYAIVNPSSPATDASPAIDAHYTKYAIQPMEFSLANGLDAAQHTVIKYVVRYKDKHGVRDLKAAMRVLELMIEREEKANG